MELLFKKKVVKSGVWHRKEMETEMYLCEEVKMLRNAVPENCASLNALIRIIINKLCDTYLNMFIVWVIASNLRYSGFGEEILLRMEKLPSVDVYWGTLYLVIIIISRT